MTQEQLNKLVQFADEYHLMDYPFDYVLTQYEDYIKYESLIP